MNLFKKKETRKFILQDDLFFGVKYNHQVIMLKDLGDDLYLIQFSRLWINVKLNITEYKIRNTIAKMIYEKEGYVYLDIPKSTPKEVSND